MTIDKALAMQLLDLQHAIQAVETRLKRQDTHDDVCCGDVCEAIGILQGTFHVAPNSGPTPDESHPFKVGDRVKGVSMRKEPVDGAITMEDQDGDEPRWCIGPGFWCYSEDITLAPAPRTDEPVSVPGSIPTSMVDRFLAWPMPADFAPDGGINFDPNRLGPPRLSPTGTNLLNATQAKAMLEHVVGPELAEYRGAVDSINEILIRHQSALFDTRAALTTAEAQRDALAEALRGGKDLIDVARMPDREHVADAHNRAVKRIRAALAALEWKP